MNKKQQQRIEQLRDSFMKRSSNGVPEKYEIKKFDITEYPTFVSVVIEVGMIGDENTLAGVLARTRGQFFIGVRGGIKISSIEQSNREVEKKHQHQWTR